MDDGHDLKGTGGALRAAVQKGGLDERFFITYGDSFLNLDFRALWNADTGASHEATMAIYKNPQQLYRNNVSYSGLGGDIRYHKFALEESVPSDFGYIDYGVSVVSKSSILERIPADRPYDLGTILRH